MLVMLFGRDIDKIKTGEGSGNNWVSLVSLSMCGLPFLDQTLWVLKQLYSPRSVA
jgi:hypothetical protein